MICLRPVIVIMNLEVVVPGEEVGKQLGNPVIFESRGRDPEPANHVLARNNSNYNLSQENGETGTKIFFFEFFLFHCTVQI